MQPHDNPRSAHFDAIAELWDGWDDLAALGRRLAAGLASLGVGGDEAVVDLGCGTGNLTLALLAALGEHGRVVAVDISPRMIQVAAGKVRDLRASFHVADAAELPLADASCDRVVCFSAWPHFPDKDAAAREMARVLRPGGQAHVWHLASRATINHIHANAGLAVQHDILPPATDTARCFATAGLRVEQTLDDDQAYLVTGRRGAAYPAMRAFWHDTWGCGRGPAARLAPATRLLGGSLLFAGCMVAPTASLAGAALAASIALAWLGACRPPWRFVRTLLGLGTVVLSPYFLLVAFLADRGSTAAPHEALIAAGGLWVRGMSGLAVSATTLTTLRISELDEALAALPAPRALSAILVQIVHQTATLAYETRRVAAGMSVRGASRGGRTAWRMLCSLPKVWLPRVVQRADRVAAAMELRGFCEPTRTARPRWRPTWRDTLALALAGLSLAAAITVRLGSAT